jgi:hypothetical protein
VRDAKDRLPELRLLRILVALGLFDRALFERTAGLLDLSIRLRLPVFSSPVVSCFVSFGSGFSSINLFTSKIRG